MKLKKILATLVAAGGLFIGSQAWATCSNYTAYASGATLTAASLNSLQTNYTNCVNAVLDGDTFTGNMLWNSGVDALFYSDTGSNLEAGIYGEDGDILGAPRAMGAYGLNLNLNSGVFTVQCHGATCTAANPAHIVMEGETAGTQVILRVTAATTFSDRTATSDLTGIGFGVTETVDWNEDIGFWFYAVNEGDTDIDNTDTNSTFAFSMDPTLAVTSSSAGDLHDIGDTAANDTNDNIFLLSDVTVANYVSQEMLLIGGFAMQWDTDTADDWTITAFTGPVGGIGWSKLRTQAAKIWTMPAGQMGNDANYYWFDTNPVTYATPGNITARYTKSLDGWVTYFMSTIAAGVCTQDGSATTSTIFFGLPVGNSTNFYQNNAFTIDAIGGGKVNNIESVFLGKMGDDVTSFSIVYVNNGADQALTENTWCDNTADDVGFTFRYKAWPE